MLKKDVSINNEIKITWASSLIMLDRSFTGKKPPDDISVNAKFSELNALIEKKFRMIKSKFYHNMHIRISNNTFKHV